MLSNNKSVLIHVQTYCLTTCFVLILQLGSVLPDLNAILDDQWMGGGTTKGHGLVLAMHLLKEQQSFNNFLHLLTDQYSMLLNGINCLEPFHQDLSKVSCTVYTELSVANSYTSYTCRCNHFRLVVINPSFHTWILDQSFKLFTLGCVVL